LLLFWFVVYWQFGRKVIDDIRKAATVAKSRSDTAVMTAVALFSLVVAGTGLMLTLGRMATAVPEHWLVTLAGSLLATAGIFAMFYCRRYLGSFWTAQTVLLPDHQVVDRGPYALVRHPIYTSAIIMYLGVALVFPTWWGILSVAVIGSAYAFKSWYEDQFLEHHLSGYPEYQRRVRYRLLPGLW
jgi:protein-S-isoprenylcysteine O-methyltransferase Ste14